MTIGLAATALLATLAAQAMTPAPGRGDEAPAWMIGDWGCYAHPLPRGGPVSTEEYWLRSGQDGMVGVGRIRQHQTRWLEHMRIAPDATGRLTYYASPGGAPPVAFPLARSGAQELVFENPAHEFPQRISYRRAGERLVATVSLLDGSRAETWHFGPASTIREQEPLCNPPAG